MSLILLVIAIICFAFRAFNFNPEGRIDIGWLGMLFFAAAFLVPGVARLL
jgi:hypothetical protein